MVSATGEDTASPESGGTAHVLPAERGRASFRTLDMTHKLDGGAEKTRRRRWIMGASRGMELGLEKYHMTREQLLSKHVKDFLEIHSSFGKRMGEGTFKPTREEVAWMSEAALNSGPFWDHYVPFLTALQSQATEAQFAEWGVRAAKLQIVGTYAQTELGHGSNVRGLQTVAVFDQQADEWVLDTPTLTSTKWWPGGMARLATHAVVYAQLILGGKSHGVHAFVVQLRDQDHKVLPGIELGELGPKMGDAGHDSGCMLLRAVRIPRTNLLERYQRVTRDGHYEKVAAVQESAVPLHYLSMLLTRASWVQLAGGQLAKACTIAVRYSAVRRQGFTAGAEGLDSERQLLDYVVQRRRLLTRVATAYAIKFAARRLLREVATLEEPNLAASEKARRMPALAAESGSLKALATLLAADGIEDLRRCCGGNGYLLSSGIAALALDDLWHVTAEGDFVVLLLAAARFLVKRFRPAAVQAPDKPGECLVSVADWLEGSKLLQEFKRRSAASLAEAAATVAAAKSRGASEEDAFNEAAEQMMEAASWHGHSTIMEAFWAEATARSQAQDSAEPPEISAVLQQLCALFGCHLLANRGGHVTAASGPVAQAMLQLCSNLRPDAVALVDAFDYEDRILNSTLGVQDGRVYEALYAASRRASTEIGDPFEGYVDHLRPHLDLNYLRQGAHRATTAATSSAPPAASRL